MKTAPKKKQFQYFDLEDYDNEVYAPEIVIDQVSKLTPMKKQYFGIKQHYPNDIVLFQRGNFYQAYLEDAHFVKSIIKCNWKEEDYLIGIHEQNIEKSLFELVLKNRRIVLCQQISNSILNDTNALLERKITGIYSRGLIGFDILDNDDIEQNLLVSLYQNEAIVIDTITKRGYYSTYENIKDLNISEIITNEEGIYKNYLFKQKAMGFNALEQLKYYFQERKINGLEQIQLYDEYFNLNFNDNRQYFYINEVSFKQLYFKNIFKTTTKEGHIKLLQFMKRTPLFNIQDRQLAIQELSSIPEYRDSFVRNLKECSGISTRLARIFNKPKDQSQVKSFIDQVYNIILNLQNKIYIHTFQSNLLNQIEKFNLTKINNIKSQIIWEGENYNIPTPGITEIRQQYLSLFERQQIIDDQALQFYLQLKQSQNLENATYKNFCIEVPDNLRLDGELIQKRKGFKKYQPIELKVLQQEQEKLEAQIKQFLDEFYDQVIKLILMEKNYFHQLIDQLSQLDVLISLSNYLQDEKDSSYPIINYESNFIFHNFKHPLIEDCIPNSLELNHAMIITGYNGEGKSTILRSIGLLIMLAQLGCKVPCQLMKFKPINSIYCRMGAQDTLRTSTFYEELKEVKDMFDKENCLLLIDELGRGTSTIDGHSLAYATLKYLLKQNNLILFTTHFNITLCNVYHVDNYILKKGQQIDNLTSRIIKLE